MTTAQQPERPASAHVAGIGGRGHHDHRAHQISVGPFEREPVGLGRLLSENFSEAVSGEEIRRRCVVWLTDRLDDAGVALGAADREIVEILASEGWSRRHGCPGSDGRRWRRWRR